MNVIKEINLGRKVVKLSATFFALIMVFSACKKEDSDIGSDLQNSELNLITTDTVTVLAYSDELEGLESDETSINLLGRYVDPVFGGVDCGIVTQILPEALTQDFPSMSEITMDSVVLAFRYSSINFYGEFDSLTLEVFEIDDALDREAEYTTSDVPTILGDNLILDGHETIFPDFISDQIVGEDTLGPQLRIRLDPSVGLDLVADSEAGLVGSDFATNTFKGLYIRTNMPGLNSGEGTVLYFALEDLLSKMTLYYRNGAGVAERFDFDINSSAARYNSIAFDRSGTKIESILADSTLGEEAFYLQGGGVRAVVEFPHLKEFNKGPNGEYAPRIINQAVLVLPIQDFQPDPFDPSTRLFIARIVDDRISTFTADFGIGSSVSGNTVTYDEDNREFRFIMTREVEQILSGSIEQVGYRIHSPSFFASTIERVIFNGPKANLKDRARLEITYTEY